MAQQYYSMDQIAKLAQVSQQQVYYLINMKFKLKPTLTDPSGNKFYDERAVGQIFQELGKVLPKSAASPATDNGLLDINALAETTGLGKKKLRLKHMTPNVVNVNVRPRKTLNVKCTKVWWSYLLPYFAQRATFSSHQPVFNCRFPNVTIKAAGGNSFYIVNLKGFAGKATRIDGEEIDSKEDRHKKFYISTVIASYKNNKATGEFHFA